mmetsp:Transcript_17357/g.40477  ORF Transcript_17357/g.40477 Transcript_17357/m.40477 type:complete len:81 (+) Transcript_17357:617-859(+)
MMGLLSTGMHPRVLPVHYQLFSQPRGTEARKGQNLKSKMTTGLTPAHPAARVRAAPQLQWLQEQKLQLLRGGIELLPRPP